jgi:hypothetical protein
MPLKAAGEMASVLICRRPTRRATRTLRYKAAQRRLALRLEGVMSHLVVIKRGQTQSIGFVASAHTYTTTLQ